jgi:hypothetical protein
MPERGFGGRLVRGRLAGFALLLALADFGERLAATVVLDGFILLLRHFLGLFQDLLGVGIGAVDDRGRGGAGRILGGLLLPGYDILALEIFLNALDAHGAPRFL